MIDSTYYLDGNEPTTPEPKQKQDHWGDTRVVGSARPRIDAYERLSGAAIYPSDVVLPDMLYGAILRCPHAHAKVLSVDTSAAEAMPGVAAIITDATPDCDIPWQPSQSAPASRLFDPHCRFEGEAVAAVAAETPYQAKDALRAIKVEYEKLPFVSDTDAALAPDAPSAVGFDTNRTAPEPQVTERGDIVAGFAEADVVLDETYTVDFQIHTALEPHGAVARWDGGKLTVWESLQGVYRSQQQIAGALGLPHSQVRVIGHYVGGGFGAKVGLQMETVVAVELARAAGAPVRVVLSRDEELMVGGIRPAQSIDLALAVSADGELLGMSQQSFNDGKEALPALMNVPVRFFLSVRQSGVYDADGRFRPVTK